MDRKQILLTVSLVLLIFSNIMIESEGLSCKGGRGACIASCKAQNCATGYCVPEGDPNAICTCTRCDTGAGWP